MHLGLILPIFGEAASPERIRRELGLGMGWHEDEFQNLGAEFHGRGRRAEEGLGTVAWVVFKELGIDTDSLGTRMNEAERAAYDLTPSQRHRLGRNDPCWCGSGKKLKQCHGI